MRCFAQIKQYIIFAIMKIIKIDSLERPELDVYLRLTESQIRNKLEPEKGIFIAESLKVVLVALKNGYKPISFLAEQRIVDIQLAELESLTSSESLSDTPVYTGDRELLASLTGYELTRGFLCAMHRPQLPTPEMLCEGRKRVAVLDGVVNSTNTGAIFRAATALGIEALLLTTTCCDPLNRRSVRVSMGTVFQMPWTYLPQDGKSASYIDKLKQLGFCTVALALSDKAMDIDDKRLKEIPRMAIIMGTEGDGLAKETIASCDYAAMIPMRRGVDSLNVAAAAAVAFWELRTI